jgi:hypothetical protein
MSSRIVGHVMDKNRRPVSKVKISLKGKTIAESEDDRFFLGTLASDESRVALTFAAEGYVTNTRVYNSKAQGRNVVVIWPIAHRLKFDPSRELDVEFESSRIRLPANALIGPNGKRSARWLSSGSPGSMSRASLNELLRRAISQANCLMAAFSG